MVLNKWTRPIFTILLIIIAIILIPIKILDDFYLRPLIFAFAFFAFHHSMLKPKPIPGLLLSILFSYSAYFIGVACSYLVSPLLDVLAQILPISAIKMEILIMVCGFIAMLSLYFLYHKIYSKTNFYKGLIFMSLAYLLIPVLVEISSYFLEEKLLTEFIILFNRFWLIIVGFSLSYFLNKYFRINKSIS
ncbi:MAG: hypothetical protein Q4G27_00330 [Flavobacteriaceae bacterium]|nr:hypothetical protein [Flavobacteriaceae bacterium]